MHEIGFYVDFMYSNLFYIYNFLARISINEDMLFDESSNLEKLDVKLLKKRGSISIKFKHTRINLDKISLSSKHRHMNSTNI